MSKYIAAYRRKRDRVVAGLREAGYSVTAPGGAFYVFPEVPKRAGDGTRGTGIEFVARAIENELLVIPGGIFSGRDTHFRISYAASDETIERGLAVLAELRQT
ncbi:MAG TPA: aminotransferase class I/II-fold pyridoxal phosphate-dependent enzyme, partial [Lacipirellulaceae bacterium]|nr:aminotransferase class I/II-fold pyridoxal phosphate-dependent enzyme [Lacipirellulaceae bacterium]